MRFFSIVMIICSLVRTCLVIMRDPRVDAKVLSKGCAKTKSVSNQKNSGKIAEIKTKLLDLLYDPEGHIRPYWPAREKRGLWKMLMREHWTLNACTPKLVDGWFQTRVAEIPRNRRCRLEMWFSSYAMHTIIDFFADSIFQLLNCMQSFRLAAQRLFSKKPSVHLLINTAVLVLARYKTLCLIDR